MGQLFLVKEGETFAGRFKIIRIGADAIQVLDQADGSSFTLALK
jgi:limonene-1,2-epoxide hydrolase